MNVSEIAQSVANDIETYGHYQGVGIVCSRYDLDKPACVGVNQTHYSLSGTHGWGAYLYALHVKVGGSVVVWNDKTPTDEVLRILRSL